MAKNRQKLPKIEFDLLNWPLEFDLEFDPKWPHINIETLYISLLFKLCCNSVLVQYGCVQFGMKYRVYSEIGMKVKKFLRVVPGSFSLAENQRSLKDEIYLHEVLPWSTSHKLAVQPPVPPVLGSSLIEI